MKIAFLYGQFSIGPRQLEFDTLYTSRRGLTGSELSCIEYARAMKAAGHDVMLIVGQSMEPREWEGIEVRPLKNPRSVDGYDAVCSWNEPDLFREISPGPVRLFNQQLNDFQYCKPGWADHVDLVTSPSAHHLEYLKKLAPEVTAWDVLPNGCDPTQYRQDQRVPGRVIWASSADRGLHRLLEAWPKIKAAAPHASLRCFYNFQPAPFDDYERPGPNVHPDLLEIAQRKRYILNAMARLSGPRWNVEHVGSVSRERMRLEFEQAEVLGYTCDSIRYTEGFSVTTMEACAAGCLPVITDIDALGQIYGSAVPMVHLNGGGFGPVESAEFVDLVVRGLTDSQWWVETVAKCQALAEQYTWPLLAKRLETMLLAAIEQKKANKKKKGRRSEAGEPSEIGGAR